MSEINMSINGKPYSGRFEVSGGVVTVRSAYGRKSTQVGSLPAVKVAELLLSELVHAALSCG